MPAEWDEFRLGDVCSKVGSGATPRGGKEAYVDEGIALIRSQNVYNHGFDHGGLARITDDQAERLSNVEVERGDVLLNITGASVARCCQVPADVLPARVNQHVAIIRPMPDVLDARFLRYYLVSPPVQAHLLQLAGAGATREAMTKAMIEGLSVPCPDIDRQRRIAAVLGALDDRIDLNRRMNRTLEVTAQALFHERFVAPLAAGALPDGWRAGSPEDTVEFNPRVKIKRGAPARYLGMSSVPTEGFEVGELEDRDYTSGSKFQQGDTLLARITPSLENGKTALVTFLEPGEAAFGSTEFIVMRGRAGVPPEFVYCLARDPDFRAFAISHMTGSSGRQRVPNDVFAHFEAAVPTADALDAFARAVHPMFDRIAANHRQSAALAETRDALLPELVSGRLRVPAESV